MSAQAGWYPDPSGDLSKLRYWNGESWTNEYTPAQGYASVAGGQTNAQQTTYTPQAGYGQPAQTYTAPTYTAPAYAPAAANDSDNTLRLVAFVFCIIGTVTIGWLLIPLAWMIPMTLRSWGIYKRTKPNTTAFAVCTLLFCSLIGGVLLLCAKKDE